MVQEQYDSVNNTTVSTEPPEETGTELDDEVIEALSSLFSTQRS